METDLKVIMKKVKKKIKKNNRTLSSAVIFDKKTYYLINTEELLDNGSLESNWYVINKFLKLVFRTVSPTTSSVYGVPRVIVRELRDYAK